MAASMDTLSFATALIAVVALGALVLLARRSSVRPVGDVKLVGRIALDAQHAVFVVEAEGRRLLLGATASGLSLLTELSTVSAGAAPGATAKSTEAPARVVALTASGRSG